MKAAISVIVFVLATADVVFGQNIDGQRPGPLFNLLMSIFSQSANQGQVQGPNQLIPQTRLPSINQPLFMWGQPGTQTHSQIAQQSQQQIAQPAPLSQPPQEPPKMSILSKQPQGSFSVVPQQQLWAPFSAGNSRQQAPEQVVGVVAPSTYSDSRSSNNQPIYVTSPDGDYIEAQPMYPSSNGNWMMGEPMRQNGDWIEWRPRY